MPAVTVLPLGSTTVTATYKDIAAASTPSNASKLMAPGIHEARSHAPPTPSPAKEDNTPGSTTSNSAQMKSSGGAKDQKGSTGANLNKDNPDKKEINSPESAQEQEKSKGNGGGKDGYSTTGTASPSQSSSSIPQAIPSHGTPQQGYYGVLYNSQMTMEPPSPHTAGGATVYDVGSFFQHAPGFHNSPFAAVHGHPYGAAASGQLQPPNSPNSLSIPPASPLFPRVTNRSSAALLGVARGELSPGQPYVSSGGSAEDFTAWGDSRTIQAQYPPSPQISTQGIPIPYVPGMPLPRSSSDRSASFDESMLPLSTDSPGGTGAATTGAVPGTLFAHQQPWGYGAQSPDMYVASSPLQPRPTVPYPGQLGGHHPHSRHHHPPHMPPYGGQYYPAASPGPPIQTTASNKGPDGANLFIFHIPNHFTNVDMYQLFYPYGNLLSVRIMVEKDTGRSRGFGFVSYDSPDAAAWAIKELNGYSIGNKRLKVQHKQIRPSDQPPYDRRNGVPGGYPDGHNYNNNIQGGGNYGAVRGMNLPPSGPMAASVGWYNNNNQRPGSNGPPNGSVVSQDTAAAVIVAGVGGEPNHTYVGEDPVAASTAATVVAGTNNSQSDTLQNSNDAEQEGSDPLSTLEPLRQALPDVGNGGGSAATSAAEGEI